MHILFAGGARQAFRQKGVLPRDMAVVTAVLQTTTQQPTLLFDVACGSSGVVGVTCSVVGNENGG